MNPINLQAYIANWLVLTNLSWRNLYDVVVYESFTNSTIELPDDVTMVSLSQLSTTWWIAGKIKTLQKQYKKILLILENTPISWIIELLQIPAWKGEKLTVIGLWTGLSWIYSLWTPIMHDIAYVWVTPISINDPHDVTQFFALLEQEWNNYIRIQSGEYPPTLLASVPVNNEWGTYSCIPNWLSWPNGTILVWWRVSNELLYACTKLQDSSILYDCFLCTDWKWSISDELRDSLLRTEKLIIVIDWNEEYSKQYAQNILFWSGLYDVEVVILSPEIWWVTTTQVEYIYDQAWFGVEWFIQELGS